MNKKVAIVTGASRGIGRAISKALAKDGMFIVVNYFNSKRQAFELVKQINKVSKAVAVQANVSDEEQVQHLIDTTIETFDKIDILINNAGAIFRPGSWQSMTKDSWNRTLEINLLGTFNCIRLTAPFFLKQKSGKIINIASTYGMLGAAPVIAYTSAKAGVINLTASFAKEFAPYVTVNAVAPKHINRYD
jgi:3-oxoacyl-[acyl-carrier protein] reductase